MQTSSVEIERVCDRADECILETAAIGVATANRGPEQLVIFVVLKEGYNSNAETLRMKFSKAIQSNLNPLFKVWPFGRIWIIMNWLQLIYYSKSENWPDLGLTDVTLTALFVTLLQVSIVNIVPEFPRTSSNKILRRVMRDQMKRELSVQSRL